MKIQVIVPNSNYNYYSFTELVDGVYTVFRYVKMFKNGVSSWETRNHYVGVKNGKIIVDHFNYEVCGILFRKSF